MRMRMAGVHTKAGNMHEEFKNGLRQEEGLSPGRHFGVSAVFLCTVTRP